MQAWEKDCADKIDEANRSDAVWDGGAATTPQGGAALTAVETLLDHLGMKENVREEMKAVVVMTDVSPVNMTVTMADGKVYEWHALSPEHTAFVEKEKIIDHEVKFLPDAKAALPPELKPIKHLLGPASISITAYSNFVDEWNDDLIENPDYSQLERIKSAAQSAGWGAAGDLAGSSIGSALAAAAALPSGPGAVAAAFSGDVAGGLTGEMISNAADNWLDGENLGEGWGNSWRDSGIPELLGLN